MLTTNDLTKVYDTILSIRGMNETVKIDLKISRKNVLLLNNVIRRGLAKMGHICYKGYSISHQKRQPFGDCLHLI
jgi:hypothetical protein